MFGSCPKFHEPLPAIESFDVCNEEFSRTSILNKHRVAKHGNSDEDMISCATCSYRTTRKDAMKRHIGAIHEGKRHQCSLCSYSGYEIRNIKQHILKKHPELVFKEEELTNIPVFEKDKLSIKTEIVEQQS